MPKISATSKTRWKLISLDHTTSKFVVYDGFMKKNREFFVPFINEVKLDGDIAFVTTVHSKVMSLNMSTATRSFITTY
jgi:hypothetical protein